MAGGGLVVIYPRENLKPAIKRAVIDRRLNTFLSNFYNNDFNYIKSKKRYTIFFPTRNRLGWT